MVDEWSISQQLIDWIFENIPEGSIILELGSGYGTGILAKKYKMYSIEHDKKFLNKYKSNYIYAPIKNGWYDVDRLKNLPKYDLLLIDGPPGNIGRQKIVQNLGLFDWSKPFIVDDTHRDDEIKLVDSLKYLLDTSVIKVIKSKNKQAHILHENSHL